MRNFAAFSHVMGRVNHLAPHKEAMKARISRQFVTTPTPSACPGLARALRHAFPAQPPQGGPIEDLMKRLDKLSCRRA